jgi:hypothetical protein
MSGWGDESGGRYFCATPLISLKGCWSTVRLVVRNGEQNAIGDTLPSRSRGQSMGLHKTRILVPQILKLSELFTMVDQASLSED